MSEMVERVARALDMGIQVNDETWRPMTRIEAARAAIEAMREPDDKTVRRISSDLMALYHCLDDPEIEDLDVRHPNDAAAIVRLVFASLAEETKS